MDGDKADLLPSHGVLDIFFLLAAMGDPTPPYYIVGPTLLVLASVFVVLDIVDMVLCFMYILLNSILEDYHRNLITRLHHQ